MAETPSGGEHGGFLKEAWHEFILAPAGGKALVIVGFLAIAGIALFIARSRANSSTQGNVLPMTADTGGVPFANMAANPPTSTGLTPPPVPPPSNAPGSGNNPLIPFDQFPGGGAPNLQFGKTITWNGVTYTTGGGSNGILWGVPGTGWNLTDWNRVPIGPGGKVLLWAPQQPQTGTGGTPMMPSHSRANIGVYETTRMSSYPNNSYPSIQR